MTTESTGTEAAITPAADPGVVTPPIAPEVPAAPVIPTIDGNIAADAAKPDAIEGDKPADDKSADGDKPADGEKPADAPIEYAEFTLPDGVTLDEKTMGEAKTLFADLKLPQEGAQKLVDFYTTKANELATAPYQQWVDMQTAWRKEVMADPELGGDNFPKTRQALAALIKGGPDNPYVTSEAAAQSLLRTMLHKPHCIR